MCVFEVVDHKNDYVKFKSFLDIERIDLSIEQRPIG